MQGLLLLLCSIFFIFILSFSTAAQTDFSTLLYSLLRLLSNTWSQGSYMSDPFSVNCSIHSLVIYKLVNMVVIDLFVFLLFANTGKTKLYSK